MRSIKNKITNSGGVSFLFALLFILTAAMVSAVLIAASLSAVKRIRNDRDITRDNLTLTSAAQLVRDEMLETTVTETVITEIDQTGKTLVNTTIDASGTFGGELKTAVENILFREVQDPDGEIQYFSGEDAVTLKVNGLDMSDVHISYTMQGSGTDKYKVIFTFTAESSDQTVMLSMTRNVVAGGEHSSWKEGTKTYVKDVYKSNWSLPEIFVPGKGDNGQ